MHYNDVHKTLYIIVKLTLRLNLKKTKLRNINDHSKFLTKWQCRPYKLVNTLQCTPRSTSDITYINAFGVPCNKKGMRFDWYKHSRQTKAVLYSIMWSRISCQNPQNLSRELKSCPLLSLRVFMSSLRNNRNLLVMLSNLTFGNLLQIFHRRFSSEQKPVGPDN